MMPRAKSTIVAVFTLLVFVAPSTASAASPSGENRAESGGEDTRTGDQTLVWADVRLPTLGYATEFISERASTPTIGVGAGLTVKPWERWGFQSRGHIQGTVSVFGEETGSFADWTLMFSRIESGEKFHASFGAGPTYLSGRVQTRDPDTNERILEPYKSFGVGAEGQLGVHLGRFHIVHSHSRWRNKLRGLVRRLDAHAADRWVLLTDAKHGPVPRIAG
jgi:hypothetical protein